MVKNKMKHSDYWRKRFELLEQSQNKIGKECFAEIEKQYRIALRTLEGEITKWYQRFAANNGITMQQARQMLNAAELEELKWDVQEYIRHGKENAVNGAWMIQLENASARYHISRLEALKLQVQQNLEIMFGNQLDSIDAAMRKAYKEGYYKTAYEIQKGIGVGWGFSGLDERKIGKVIKKPWAPDGKNFSKRIWNNREKLVNELHTELSRNIITGQDPQKAINAIARKMKVSKSNAGRLVMTELAFFSSAAQGECFRELGVEQFEIVATLDSHTSEICREMDLKHFPMCQYEVGITAPPFHVWCRSCTCPYFDDEFDNIGKRAARGADGKTYHVPGNMSYQDWQKTFVESNPDKETVANYLVRNHVPGQNAINERKAVNEALGVMPKKVQEALQQGTIIDVGKTGASQYDYVNDILYIAKGADKEEVIHEIGHVVENKLMDKDSVSKLRRRLVEGISINDILRRTMYDSSGKEHEVFIIKSDAFVSEYQGRMYADDWDEIYDENWRIRDEKLWEFISEPFREYIQNPKALKAKYPEFYNFVKEAVE